MLKKIERKAADAETYGKGMLKRNPGFPSFTVSLWPSGESFTVRHHQKKMTVLREIEPRYNVVSG